MGNSYAVIGGTGSLGRTVVFRLLQQEQAERVVIFSRGENAQSYMRDALSEHKGKFRFFIGDVRDADRVRLSLRNIDYVIHAAAMKHVAACEYNNFEAIRTNILGTENVVKACISNGVRRALFISTDKAVNPINTYGVTKLCAEKVFLNANYYSGNTRFSVMRFGNFLNSEGSVFKRFATMYSNGCRSFPITSPDAMRFFITLETAAEQTIECLHSTDGNEIFIPFMEEFNILEMVKLKWPDADYQIVGMPRGEKLREEMMTAHEAKEAELFEDCYRINCSDKT